MKKKTIKISLKKILCFILAIVVIYYGGMMVRAATTPSTDIIFEDANLYKSLKERLPSSAIISSNDNTKTLSIANDSFTTITQIDLSSSSISNLSGIEYLSSSVIRVFISIMRKIKDKNGRLVLACVPDIIKKILKTVELEDLFEVYESVDDAVDSF